MHGRINEMTCDCGYADECDGETALFHPLQDGGLCSVRSCNAPKISRDESDAGQNDGVHSIFNACMFRKSCKAKDAEIERLRADAARSKGLIQRLATEARQSGDLVRDPEALALAAMYYGA